MQDSRHITQSGRTCAAGKHTHEGQLRTLHKHQGDLRFAGNASVSSYCGDVKTTNNEDNLETGKYLKSSESSRATSSRDPDSVMNADCHSQSFRFVAEAHRHRNSVQREDLPAVLVGAPAAEHQRWRRGTSGSAVGVPGSCESDRARCQWSENSSLNSRQATNLEKHSFLTVGKSVNQSFDHASGRSLPTLQEVLSGEALNTRTKKGQKLVQPLISGMSCFEAAGSSA